MFTTGQCATLACLLEVTAPKPGNVHRAADFEDTTLNDFVASAVAIGPAMDQARHVGKAVLDAVRATQTVTRANTNLGIVLLLAPLAVARSQGGVRSAVDRVLHEMSPDDAAAVYEAIRIASPGGLRPADKEVSDFDVERTPPTDLRLAMREAADRDMIARQYVNAYREVFDVVVPDLLDHASLTLPDRIVHCHVQMMSAFPDSLIGRKGGESLANESAARATAVLESGEPGSEDYYRALSDLDFWLRNDGHRRNPGTTADLIAAGLFVLLCEESIRPPFG